MEAGSEGVWPAHHLPLAAMEANANTSNCRRSHAMAGKLTIWTYDWVPAGPRGFVRDLRLRWAAEEAGLAHDVRTVPFEAHGTHHMARPTFGQQPVLDADHEQ